MDDTDRRILIELQADGRITNQELAERIHLSRSACLERVARLREQGVITGYTALIDPKAVGLPLLIFVEVSLDRTTRDACNDFEAAIAGVPAVLECHMVGGGFDYLLKARVPDMEGYHAFLSDVLMTMAGVRETRTYAVLKAVKSTTVLPLAG